MAKATTKRTSRASRGGPSGIFVWMLWLIIIALLAVVARYAFIAAQPDRAGYTLFGREGSLEPAGKPNVNADKRTSVDRAMRKPKKDYSEADRAKLDELVDAASPSKR
ncbi:hypothetical protein Q4F19_12745 [Sphingomonas sp. BIUV-7]|uniref:Uncharacterized protein n=1 Tax=Sphingomonas natans TaxID=3063330 RepID=A0ABT8YA91_9SPHN|nr:hypothetical protein [Sphingomonas sp. BIUV-7]MDO6415253.1 hypothetical protein [Sphingomonas sp. BIUV-7]